MQPLNRIYNGLVASKLEGKKSFAVLLDPDKCDVTRTAEMIKNAEKAKVDYFFVGGSLMITNRLDELVHQIKSNSDIPVILFPGSPAQVSSYADALLYLSLISGRNAELLIGQHVISAPIVKQSNLEVMSTGYMVIDGGAPTTVSYISNAAPIPSDKVDIAICTAMAGEMLGMKLIYLDAGSGAKTPISESMIAGVARNISVPLIIGGGIKSPVKAFNCSKAGADIVVVGNAIEKDSGLIEEISAAVHSVTIYAN